MRKRIVSLFVALVMILALCASVSAAGAGKHEVKALNGQTAVSFNSDEQKNLSVEVTGLADGQYVLLVLKATIKDDWTYTASSIAQENILYIDQAASADGKLTFSNVFPKNIANSVIMISGAGTKTDVALIKAAYVLGDVNGDDNANTFDAMLIARREIGIDISPNTFNADAGDVNGDGNTDTFDAMLIARREIGLIDKFPIE